jgi:DoxX-like protein
MLWASYVVSGLPVLMLLASAVMKFARPGFVVEGMQKHGYPESMLLGLGIVELTCTVLYLIPQTSVLGAMLLTGYLGGATATHVRVGEISQAFLGPVFVGVLVWLGLFLRDPRLRALVPLRKPL